jgi:hypothetical protein
MKALNTKRAAMRNMTSKLPQGYPTYFVHHLDTTRIFHSTTSQC